LDFRKKRTDNGEKEAFTMPERVAVFPPAGSPLGLRSWAREFAAAVAVTIHPASRPQGELPRGDGRAVLLIPGFASGDWTLVRLRTFLSELGYGPETAHVWFNAGPTPALMLRLENALLCLSTQGQVSLIGVSLGGVLARDLARRFPHAVRCVITLCSPVRFPVTTPLEPLARLLSPLYAPEWLSRRHDIALPLEVPVTAIHATSDGIVPRDQCWIADSPGCRNVVVNGRHMTIASNPESLAVIARALAIC
jgi:pimeloyl-ACP methyl ester carboxylesterase